MLKLHKLEKQLTEVEQEIEIQKQLLKELQDLKTDIVNQVCESIPEFSKSRTIGSHVFTSRVQRRLVVTNPAAVVEFFNERDSLEFIDVKVSMKIYDTLNNIDVKIPGVVLKSSTSNMSMKKKNKS